MDIFRVHQDLIDDYRLFTTSAIKPRDPRVSQHVADELGKQTQWPEPWLSLNPMFASGGSWGVRDEVVKDRLARRTWGTERALLGFRRVARNTDERAGRDRQRARRQFRVRLWRVLPWDPSARIGQPGHPLWVPREFQGGAGRHDAPDLHGVLYLAEQAVSAVAEALAPFRGTGDLNPAMLERPGRDLVLVEVELAASAVLVDLDDPAVLVDELLRPSVVAARERSVTQTYASE